MVSLTSPPTFIADFLIYTHLAHNRYYVLPTNFLHPCVQKTENTTSMEESQTPSVKLFRRRWAQKSSSNHDNKPEVPGVLLWLSLCSLEHTSLKDGKTTHSSSSSVRSPLVLTRGPWPRSSPDFASRCYFLWKKTTPFLFFFPKNFLNVLNLDFFLSYTERMHVSICQTWMRCVQGEKVRFLSKHKLFTSGKSFSHTGGHKSSLYPFFSHLRKQILISILDIEWRSQESFGTWIRVKAQQNFLLLKMNHFQQVFHFLGY